MLAVCAVGCRQVETLGSGNVSISTDRPQSLPTDAPEKSSPRAVEVCRLPWEETDDRQFITPREIVPARCDLSGSLGSVRPLACGEYEMPPANLGDASKGFAELAIGPAGPVASLSEACPRDPKTRFEEILASTQDNVFGDYVNYYSRRTLAEFVAILAPAAVFANSDLDADVGDWYQHHVRSHATNRAADVLPAAGQRLLHDTRLCLRQVPGRVFRRPARHGDVGRVRRPRHAGAAGGRSAAAGRAVPDRRRAAVDLVDQSYWKPFHGSHGASGHAFMGAVPFLTLAGMTDDPLAKCFFYACSPWTGMTRINDNVHYLSQVWLGWWMAYLACEPVNKTETRKGPLLIPPLCTPEMTGVGVIYQQIGVIMPTVPSPRPTPSTPPSGKQRIHDYFSRGAQFAAASGYWAFDFQRQWAKHRRAVARELRLVEQIGHWMPPLGRRVLVMGSWLGAEAIAYALCGAEVTAIDLDGEALALSAELAARYGTSIRTAVTGRRGHGDCPPAISTW